MEMAERLLEHRCRRLKLVDRFLDIVANRLLVLNAWLVGLGRTFGASRDSASDEGVERPASGAEQILP